MEKLKQLKTTLTLFIEGDKILLGEKKRGFAKGTLNGIGGKQDPGETIEQAMIRECVEEIGAKPIDYTQVGKIDFDLWYKGEHSNMEMFIYKCFKYSGTIKETEEIIPHWFDIKNPPLDRMLPDDLLWLPKVLEGKNIMGKVKFDPEMNMLDHKFKVVKSFDKKEMVK